MSEQRFEKTRKAMQEYLQRRESDGFRRVTLWTHAEDEMRLRAYVDRKLKARGWKKA